MDDIANLKKLAGISEFKGYKQYNPLSQCEGINISISGTEKSQLMKKHNIKPGTEEWFKLWFSRPYMTGESPI